MADVSAQSKPNERPSSGANMGPRLTRGVSIPLVMLGLAVILAVLRPFLPDFLIRVPDWAVLPYDIWMQAIFDFIREDLGLIHVTRGISGVLEWFLDSTANLLYGKNRFPFLGPLPWTAVTAVIAVLGFWLGGWKLSLLAGGTFTWVALIGQWDLAMQSLSVIVVSVPLAFLFGLTLGILAWKSARFEAAVRPLLAVLQTLPFFTYLLPAVIFFKVGPTAGAVATIAYAIPPMVLMTTLGLKKVSPDVVEAGLMSGCTPWQMLRSVYLPAARTEILVGVNQVIMLSLAMVVLTAFIGMPGLGAKLLALMNSLKLGRSFEIGITIVLIAVTLDRLSKAWVVKQPEYFARGTAWWKRHRMALLALGLFVLLIVLAQLVQILDYIARDQDLSMGQQIDDVFRAALANDTVVAITSWLRGFLITSVFIPFRDAVLWVPTPAIILAIAAAGYAVGGLRSAVLVAALFSFCAITGWWDRSMISLYAVVTAVMIAAVIGLPLGVLAARNKAWAEPILLVCDTAQTFPSFIYLIPAIMLFGVNDVSVIFSILIFATVPLMRYTIEGIRAVPEEMLEAADMSGASRSQKLWNVQIPLALPTIAIGFNQAIMFAFFMVIIAAFIGTQDLGQELQKTLAGNQLGKNVVLGLCVSVMALSFGHIIVKWAATRRKMLGLE